MAADALREGFTAERVEVLRCAREPLRRPAPDRVLEALTEFDATFPAREARAVALERSAGAPIDDALRQLGAARGRRDPPPRRRERHDPRAPRPRTAVIAIVKRLAEDRTVASRSAIDARGRPARPELTRAWRPAVRRAARGDQLACGQTG